ncbi:hypothetical protein ACTXP0_11760 [Psychrobacter celer]|uniref:hypothetical protein n=1 Tax=Psychrobacter celer TaxID=306572 RepID=UPI003FD668FA
MNSSVTYLLSSFKENPDNLFQGYCFVNKDLIVGEAGAYKYFNETGQDIQFGEDGCYVLAKKIEEGYLVGSDCSGYKKILYFHDARTGHWAVSNSLNVLIEHLKENAVNITPNIPLISLMAESAKLFQHPVTFNTIVNEIKVLPLNTTLIIGNNVLKVCKIDEIKCVGTNYHDILLNFVNIWVSRFLTLLNCESTQIQQGLTGGVDSRALFSLSNYSNSIIKDKVGADYRLVSSLTRGDDTDIKIAQKISERYGYRLNNKSPSLYNPKPLSSKERYYGWKDICLGLYYPIYFPYSRVDFRKIAIGGHGGENYRKFYAKNSRINDYNDFIKYICRYVNESDPKVDLAIDLYATLSNMQEADMCGEEIDPLILHYRHFRSRFHSGLFPQYRISFTPLSSRYLNSIATKANAHKMESSQVLYDLINITNGLLEIPYDSSNKAPKSINISDLTEIQPSVNLESGSIYYGDENFETSKSEKSIFEYLKDDFDNACNTELVKRLWSKESIAMASKVLDEAKSRKRFNHASDGCVISAIIAAGVFDK